MESDSLEAKEAWLSDLVKNHPSEVDAEAYCVVLQSIAQSDQPGAPQRAEELLSRMTVEPDDSCYRAVMEAWVKSSSDDASVQVLRTERWFMKIKEPALEVYHLLLDVLSKGSTKVNNRARNKELLISHATKAEQVLSTMLVPPDTIAFNYVVRAWLKVKTDPELMTTKVMKWLRTMEAHQQKTPAGIIQPNTKSYAMAMEGYAILAAHRVKSGTGDGHAELRYISALLNYMHELQKRGQPNVAPNTVVYNILISTLARLSVSPHHKNAPLEAEEVLRHMVAVGEDIAPDQLSFTRVIHAWVNAKRETSAERAAYWLDTLWELYEANGEVEELRPTIGIYNMVMRACRGDPKRTEEVFVELIRAEKEDSSRQLRPNSESFSVLIHSWVKHDLSRAAMWLEELLRRESNTDDSGPTVTASPELFQVIVKQASTMPSPDNLALALKIFDLFRSSRHSLDVHTYAWLVTLGLAVFSEPYHDVDRNEFIADIIRDCKSDGLVSNCLIRVLANGPVYITGWTAQASREIVKEYFSDWPLPGSWTRNVPTEFLPQEIDTIRVNREDPQLSAWEKQ
ncbi:Pentatricopeptide repeat domain [Fragilaria crotonensis]|nr:Pentatricopeptide repeat domain [Fragilaria crotonensis]